MSFNNNYRSSIGSKDLLPEEKFRQEKDSMGTIEVPLKALWGPQTQRAVNNFPVSGMPIDNLVIWALAIIKQAAAKANAELGVIDPDVSAAIQQAASLVSAGQYNSEFPVDVFQTGSGTSSNMNMNEVVANLATSTLGRKVLPNDEVNACQSSNDVFPSAVQLACLNAITFKLVPAWQHLRDILWERSEAFKNIVKSGRTHLMDATPITLGQEFSGYASAIDYGIERILGCVQRLGELPLGGTAVGTGLNAPVDFASLVIDNIRAQTNLKIREARNHFEAQGFRDALVETSGACKVMAVSLNKISNDLRWMSSGPRCGLAEISLPDLQPGSSIMPGKVNPVIPEAVCQVSAQVIGNDSAVSFAGAAGNFELNVMLPVMAKNLLESLHLLSSIANLFADKCIKDIQANEQRCQTYALSSPAIATALNPFLGYEKVAELVKQSIQEDKDLKTVVLESKLLSPEVIETALDVLEMTKGGIRSL